MPVREEPTVGQKRSKKEARDSRETTPVTSDRPSGSDNTTTNLSTNNNTKATTVSATRQENNGTRNRTVRTETPLKAPSNTVENADSRGARSTNPPLESKTFVGVKDSKPKSTTAARNGADLAGNSNRKISEQRKTEMRVVEETRRVEEKSKSFPENLNDEIISVVIPNRGESAAKKDWKDSKEAKGKQKRKSKAVSKKEEKDKRIKAKESTAVKCKDDEGAVSDDSCSDGSSDKSVPDVRIQQPSKEVDKTRPESLPNDVQMINWKDQQSGNKPGSQSTSADSADTGRDRGKTRKNVVDNVGGKSRKGEAQSASNVARPRTLEVPSKNQNNANKNHSNVNSPDGGKTSDMRPHPGATSPHAIAAAVMSLALGKNMQASSKENSFDEQELNKRKAYTKSPALSTSLSDSPPPTSPNQLSGSSRSSSYSSIVSSDSSSGMETVKQLGAKGNKARVKGTKSVPLDEGPVPSWSGAGKDVVVQLLILTMSLPFFKYSYENKENEHRR